VDDDSPFGYDSLKLRAIFVPEGNPDTIAAADVTDWGRGWQAWAAKRTKGH